MCTIGDLICYTYSLQLLSLLQRGPKGTGGVPPPGGQSDHEDEGYSWGGAGSGNIPRFCRHWKP